MTLHVNDVLKSGDPILATEEATVRSAVNAVLNAYRASVVGGQLHVPSQLNLQRITPFATLCEAVSESGTFPVGEVVQITQIMPPENNPGDEINSNLGVIVKEIDSRVNRPIAVIVEDVSTSEGGVVALDGTVLAKVKQQAGVPPADEALLNQFGVAGLESASREFELRFGMGAAELLWHEAAATLTDPHWGVVRFPARNSGAQLVKSVGAETAGTIDLKFTDKAEDVRGGQFNLPVVTLPPCE